MMTSDTITVTIAPEPDRVRILATTPTRDLLKAFLGPPEQAHPRAAATLLEGISLWYQRPLSVVLSADGSDDGCALGLCDALGVPDGRALLRGRRRDRASVAGAADVVTFAAWATFGDLVVSSLSGR